MSLEEWQIALRREYGREQKFRLKNIGGEEIFSEFLVTNPATKRTYRIAIRGNRPGDNYCSCPDFAVNTLGTCKHIEFTLAKLEKNREAKKALRAGFQPPYSEIYLRYGAKREIQFIPGRECPKELQDYASKFFDRNGILKPDGYSQFDSFIKNAPSNGHDLRCHEDAIQFVAQIRDDENRRKQIEKAFPQGETSTKFKTLLKVDLYPYQRTGALFAANAGRCLIGDDMGLGKTIQALAAVEILALTTGVERVLIICPTSLKHQWRREIEKFSKRSAEVIEGSPIFRRNLYNSDTFYKIINYEVVHNDLDLINQWSPNVIILDEAQRIKNWQTRRAQTVKRLQSEYAIVLTGTPLENRLEELHSIVEFVDRFRLGPLFRYLAEHQQTDEVGKVVGYTNLSKISETLKPILIRRTKKEVLKELPQRVDNHFYVPMTPQQRDCHESNRETVAQIVHKWRKFGFLSERDQRILRIALQFMRMSCNSTFLIDKETDHGVKADELIQLLDEILEDPSAKVVVFSQWIGTHQLIAKRLETKDWKHVFFHGSLSGKERNQMISSFNDDPDCRIFLSTDAGGVGLNLQNAAYVVNMDQPWNPAVLEQRIGRVHRLGQKRSVHVFHYIAQGTIEHSMLDVLAFKKSVFAGVLDGGENEVFLGGTRLNKFMDTVDQVAQGISEKVPTEEEKTPVDDTLAADDTDLLDSVQKKETPGANGQEKWIDLISSGLDFINKLGDALQQPTKETKTSQLIERDEKTGKAYIKLPIPEQDMLNKVAEAIKPFLKLLNK